MRTLLLSYDLSSEASSYAELEDRIRALGHGWWHHLDSTWIIRTDDTPVRVRDALRAILHDGDEILVVDISDSAAAWSGFSERGGLWLRRHLT